MLDDFTRQYTDTALWADLPEGIAVADVELSPEFTLRAAEDCAAFMAQAGPMIEGRETDAAHDFWLTRQGHGAGFWDGDWPEHGDALTELSNQFGEVWLYVGDDGLIYV